MSEMNTPLQWDAPTAAAATPAPAVVPGFAWPVPPEGGYGTAQAFTAPQGCEIEGVNGKLIAGRLLAFKPAEGQVLLQLSTSRAPLALRFNQFRSLVLLDPLVPEGAESLDTRPAEPDTAPGTPYRLNYADGEEVQGRSLGHVIADYGLFLFHPLGADGALQRCFVPGAACGAFSSGEAPLAPEAPPAAAAAEPSPLGQPITTPEQLAIAIDAQARMPMVRVGEALLSLGLVTREQLEAALDAQRSDRSVPLGELLVRRGIVSRQGLQSALARKMGYPLVDLARFPTEIDAVRCLPYASAAKLQALPLLLRGGRLVVAMEEPARPSAIAEIEFAAQMKLVPVLASVGSIDAALRGAYERAGAAAGGLPGGDAQPNVDYASDDTDRLIESLEREGQDRTQPDEDRQIEQADNSLVRLINSMIIEAWNQGVSDIHIESYPGREKIKIRFRKDGVMQPYLELPHTYRNAMIGRIKIMCDLDISERRKPQDGKINFARFSPSHRVELRVATIPTAGGLEDVVMRILASAKPLPLEKLGLSPHNLAALKRASERPYGLILCVGPTGSGKTTTLHSALAYINRPERKIWTAEDPVEITQAGLRQVQVNPKIDWTFAKALRAFLRADPDVIMVGEIRDKETAGMAVEASLTGHLVMSTLHTNSAPETVTRLLDMGMDPFNFADSLLVVLAQRLVRRLCSHCVVRRPATPDEVDELLADHLHVGTPEGKADGGDAVMANWLERFGVEGRLMHSSCPGCRQCGQSGYKGRAGLHELMTVSREVRHLIQTGERSEHLQTAAMRGGMRTLRQDGIEKVWAGVTTIDEVRAMSNV